MAVLANAWFVFAVLLTATCASPVKHYSFLFLHLVGDPRRPPQIFYKGAYSHTQTMMPGYNIHWTVNEAQKYINLALEVNTMGSLVMVIRTELKALCVWWLAVQAGLALESPNRHRVQCLVPTSLPVMFTRSDFRAFE